MMDLFSIGKINPKRLKKEDLIVLDSPNNSRFHRMVQWVGKEAEYYQCNQMFTSRYRLRFKRTDRTLTIGGHTAIVFEYEKIVRVWKTTAPYDKANKNNR